MVVIFDGIGDPIFRFRTEKKLDHMTKGGVDS